MEPYELENNRPPLTDAEVARVRRIEGLRRIRKGEHREHFYVQDNTQHAFKAIGPNFSRVLYLCDNLPGMCTLKHCDLLLGEPVAVNPPEELADNRQVLEAIRRISLASRLDATLYDLAATAGWAGKAYMQAIARNGQVRIEAVDPALVTPRYEPGGKELLGATIKQQVSIAGRDYCRVTDHRRGRIVHRLYELNGRGLVQRRAPLDLIRPGMQEIEQTGIDALAIVEIRNYTWAGEGASDYEGCESIIDEINNRLTQISRILDQHGDPAVVALEELFDEQGNLRISGRAISVNSMEQGDPVRYLTWDAKLEFCAAQLERAMHAFLRQQEISPALVGMGGGTSADGWKKFRLQNTTTLARVNRKELFSGPGFAEAIRVAMLLENAVTIGVSYPVQPVTLTFSDGIPPDETEEMQIVTGYRAAGLMSMERALMRVHNDRQVVADELAKLGAEAEATLPTSLRGGVLEQAEDGHG